MLSASLAAASPTAAITARRGGAAWAALRVGGHGATVACRCPAGGASQDPARTLLGRPHPPEGDLRPFSAPRCARSRYGPDGPAGLISPGGACLRVRTRHVPDHAVNHEHCQRQVEPEQHNSDPLVYPRSAGRRSGRDGTGGRETHLCPRAYRCPSPRLAPTEGRVMYAGLRALPMPQEPVARLWHAANMLREHRGDGHIAALVCERIGGTRGPRAQCSGHGHLPGRVVRPDPPPPQGPPGRSHGRPARRGLLDASGRFTDAGRATKTRIESLTDALAQAPCNGLEPLELEQLTALLEPISKSSRPPDRSRTLRADPRPASSSPPPRRPTEIRLSHANQSGQSSRTARRLLVLVIGACHVDQTDRSSCRSGCSQADRSAGSNSACRA